jgi:hypothetical protein
MRRGLSAALVSAFGLLSRSAFADVVPDNTDTVEAVCFFGVAGAMVVLVGIWIVVRRLRRR